MPFELMLPWILIILAALLGMRMDRIALNRRPNGERGDYWCRIVAYYIYPMTGFILLSQFLVSLKGWPMGWHLYLDLLADAPEQSYWIALFFPFIGWVLALMAGLKVKPSCEKSARCLAGGVGFANSRYWLLACTLPLMIIIIFKAEDLGGGEGAYPAALWSTLAVLTLSLIGVALSAGKKQLSPLHEVSINTKAKEENSGLKAWPELLKAHAIDVRRIFTWQPYGTMRPATGSMTRILLERLESMGAINVAPELIEAIASLLKSKSQDNQNENIRLVFAADGCGQVEGICLAATLLEQRLHTVTLVVTAHGAAELAKQFQRWLPEAARRIVALEHSEIPSDALIWVVDAEFLSDRLLALLKDSNHTCRRIGLVVWWQLHDYTGVMAANLWAITRRLYRLLHSLGRHDLRSLVLLRRASHADAQLDHFVRCLLPQSLTADIETHIELRLAHPIVLHKLETANHDALNPIEQYLLLQAGDASLQGSWPTCIEAPDYISASELMQFQQASLNDVTRADKLCSNPTLAGVRLLQIKDADLLAIPEILSQGGRSISQSPHHVGIILSMNPYAAYLLTLLEKNGQLPSSRRLVCLEACPTIIKRHMLLALHELPDTRQGLLKNARWDVKVVDATLKELSMKGQLSPQEIRFLDENDRLVDEAEYQSKYIPNDQYCPLDTVGLNLIEVRENVGNNTNDGVRLRVDPERLLIKAYPRRVFMHQGQRYRIRDWNSLDEVKQRGWLECMQYSHCVTTWRIHNAFVYGVRPLLGDTSVAIGKHGQLVRLAADVIYEEEVTGVIETTTDVCRNPMLKPQTSYFDNPITQTFQTRALILRLQMQKPEFNALPSLCQALRYTLPVHLGVEADAWNVVTLNGEDIDGEETFGLAIVDLYPGGIGLIDAIHDDNNLLLHVLEQTHNWLASCSDEILQTNEAKAANPDRPASRMAALKLLKQII